MLSLSKLALLGLLNAYAWHKLHNLNELDGLLFYFYQKQNKNINNKISAYKTIIRCRFFINLQYDIQTRQKTLSFS